MRYGADMEPYPPGADLMAKWLRDRRIKQTTVARVLLVTPSAVHDWLLHKRTPSLQFRDALERWTSGAVPATSWLSSQDLALLQHLTKVEPYVAPPEKGEAP